MRLQRYITKDNVSIQLLLECMYFIGTDNINEMSDKTLAAIENIAKKFGLKVKRSDSLFTYLKDAGKVFDNICRMAALYVYTDVTDTKTRKMLAQMAKKEIKDINKHKVAAFALQLERSTIGITGIFRHFVQGVLGVEVGAYTNWIDDISYFEKEMVNAGIVLKRMGAEKELKALEKFRDDTLKSLRAVVK